MRDRLKIGLLEVELGSFYVNACVWGHSPEKLSSFLSAIPSPSYIGPQVDRWTCFVNEYLDMQDQEVIDVFGMRLSEKGSAKVISVLNHDSDILSVDVFEEGRRTGSYNSCPGYFASSPSEESLKPRLKNANAYSGLKEGVSPDDIHRVFCDDVAHLGADELHQRIIRLLGLPDYSFGAGFRYVAEDGDQPPWTFIPASHSTANQP